MTEVYKINVIGPLLVTQVRDPSQLSFALLPTLRHFLKLLAILEVLSLCPPRKPGVFLKRWGHVCILTNLWAM